MNGLGFSRTSATSVTSSVSSSRRRRTSSSPSWSWSSSWTTSLLSAAVILLLLVSLLPTARGWAINKRVHNPNNVCSPAEDGMERFACPTKDRHGEVHCIEDHVLCDGLVDCPGAEDEDATSCMFYLTTKSHLDVLADALLRWARGRW